MQLLAGDRRQAGFHTESLAISFISAIIHKHKRLNTQKFRVRSKSRGIMVTKITPYRKLSSIIALANELKYIA